VSARSCHSANSRERQVNALSGRRPRQQRSGRVSGKRTPRWYALRPAPRELPSVGGHHLTGRSRPRAAIGRILALLTDCAPIERILGHIGEPSRPPSIAPARGPPAWDDAPEPVPDCDLLGRPESDVEFDQRVSW